MENRSRSNSRRLLLFRYRFSIFYSLFKHMERTKITIIGAGIVGLAAASLLSRKYKDMLVIERHTSFGQETSSRNSEVIHAGLYYPPGSLKADCCIKGKDLLYEYCRENDIPCKRLGKLIIAPTTEEEPGIKRILENARACGVTNLAMMTAEQIEALEPDIQAHSAVYSPDTGIVDTHAVMKSFYEESKSRGAEFAFGIEVIGIKKHDGYYEIIVKEPAGEHFSFESEYVINAAGLCSGQLAQMAGIDIQKHHYEIQYSKGQYFRISNPKKYAVYHLIYPPPSPTDLGIHITPDLAGGLRLGPDAAYVDAVDYSINEKDKGKFFESVRRFLPELTEEELISDTAGIRPKLQKPGEAFYDFVISHEDDKGFPGLINLIGIESPGLTSCLAIAKRIDSFIC